MSWPATRVVAPGSPCEKSRWTQWYPRPFGITVEFSTVNDPREPLAPVEHDDPSEEFGMPHAGLGLFLERQKSVLVQVEGGRGGRGWR